MEWLRSLDPARRQRLDALSRRILEEKRFSTAHDLVLDDDDRLRLAQTMARSLLEFGGEGLSGWREVIVYPGAFRVQREHHDEHSGLVSEWDDELSGESWQYGPLILSWDDFVSDVDEPEAGFDLVAHEMAHKLDALDGVMDGTPPLPRAWQKQWAADFQQAFDALNALLDDEREPPIDDYAAESPEEFFAVVSEYHFSAPEILAAHYPAVAAHLRRFYGAPLALTAPAESTE